jgi:hypothetical protein
MTRKYAEELGRRAFEAGIGNFPLANGEIYAEVKDAKVGEKRHILKAFSRGWHTANLLAVH